MAGLEKEYFRRRGASSMTLDFILLMNNTLQMKTLLLSDNLTPLISSVCALLGVSIILQVILGVLLAIQTGFENSHVKKRSRYALETFMNVDNPRAPVMYRSTDNENPTRSIDDEASRAPVEKQLADNENQPRSTLNVEASRAPAERLLADNENQRDYESGNKKVQQILRINTSVTVLTFLILAVNIIIQALGN